MLSSALTVIGRATRASLLLFIAAAFVSEVSASTIAGFVYDDQRNPLIEVDVELLNENRVLLDRVRTNGVGRYQFNNISDGRYYIKALPFRYNLIDKEEEVIVDSFAIRGGGATFVDRDIYLQRKKGGLGETTTGVVFAQEVPKEAEDLFRQGIEALGNENKTEGMTKLIEAVNAFPTYYAASQRLGMELLKTRQYMDAAKLFMRAAEINPKSSVSFYYAGFALSQIGKEYNRAALVALEKARGLANTSFEVMLLIGKIQRKEGDFVEAEKALLTAKKLASERVPEIHIELAQLYGNDLKQFGKAADELELYMKASDKKDEKIKQQIEDLRAKARRST